MSALLLPWEYDFLSFLHFDTFYQMKDFQIIIYFLLQFSTGESFIIPLVRINKAKFRMSKRKELLHINEILLDFRTSCNGKKDF